MSRFKKFPVQKPGANDFIFCTKHSDTDQFCKKTLYILRSRRNSKTPARQGKIVENKQKHPTISPNAWLFWASWGGRGRTFKSCRSDQVNGGCKSSVYLYFTRVFRTFGCGIFLYRASKKCSENSEKSSLYIIWYIGSNGAFHRSVEANA